MTRVSVLVPAFNEAERISATITAIASIPNVDEIIVIDDGSTDGTASAAERAGADAVLVRPHGGKGAALNGGYKVASGDVLLLLDADLGSTAVQAARLLEPVRTGSADMTIATFPVIPGKGGGVGLVVGTARAGISELTGRTMQAPLSGQRAVSRRLLDEIGGFAEGWGVEVALTVKALWLDFAVIEIPTEMTHRVTGRSLAAIRHRAAQYLAARRVLIELTNEKARFMNEHQAQSIGKKG
jgi:glycosyltransferase involved in cell wall biosynthesis